jgi:Ran GTPase-activating protein (RanGAP) involved in mRNA processing and transport
MKTNLNFCNFKFSQNNLGNEGASLIAEAISETNHIVSLDLSSNSLSPVGAEAIFKALI